MRDDGREARGAGRGEITLQRFGWRYLAVRNGETVAELTAEIHGEQALIHHRVNVWGRHVFAELVLCWGRIRRDLKEAGVSHLVASADNYDEKLGKYWQAMGFECFGQTEVEGKTVHFAVMEV